MIKAVNSDSTGSRDPTDSMDYRLTHSHRFHDSSVCGVSNQLVFMDFVIICDQGSGLSRLVVFVRRLFRGAIAGNGKIGTN